MLSSKEKDFALARLKCPKCAHVFGIERNYIGTITCPYCGELVEEG